MKKYKVNSKRCLRCGGLISWDDFPDIEFPIHVDKQGIKIGDGSCPRFRKKYQQKKKDIKESRFSREEVKALALLGIICLILIPLGIGLIIYNTSNENAVQSDKNSEDGDEDTTETWEIDEEGTATYIVDGDTYDINSVGRIRLADIDTPDQGEAGYEAAKNYLSSLIYDKKVSIDIDDKYRTDKYGRIVAVTYVRYNSTHLLNVNKDLLIKGYAVVWNFDNDFNPSSWSLYVYYL